MNASFARQLRLSRMLKRNPGGLLMVPLDHPISDGPVTGGRRVATLITKLAAGGADAVVLHKGCLRYIDPGSFQSMSLVVHLSASTAHAPDPDAKYLVTSVEEALRLGADAVSVHVNLGSREEGRQIADLGQVADACDRWNMPLMAMMYPRGPKISNPGKPELVEHAAIIAADLGADLVKVPWVGSVAAMSDLADSCPIPIVVAGGPKQSTPSDLVSFVMDVIDSGAAGLAMGRNVFQASDPEATIRQISLMVHGATFGVIPRLETVPA